MRFVGNKREKGEGRFPKSFQPISPNDVRYLEIITSGGLADFSVYSLVALRFLYTIYLKSVRKEFQR